MEFIWFIMLMFVCVMLVVKGPHPIFGPPPGAIPDLENPDEEEVETPGHKRRRFEQMGGEHMDDKIYGTGVDFTVREKRFVLKLYENCVAYWNRDNCESLEVRGMNETWWRHRPRDVRNEFFTEITGISGMTVTRLQSQRDTDSEVCGPVGMLMPSRRTGAEREGCDKKALEAVFADLDEFIRDEIDKARKQKYLTTCILAQKATDYFRSRITPQRMRRALKRLGYEYKKREGKYINRRCEGKNLFKLKSFCEWVEGHVEYNEEADMYKFTIPVAFGDGASEYTKSFRAKSWMMSGDPKLSKCEKPRKDKDGGQRLNMLGAIYGNSFDMASFTAWNSQQQGKNPYATYDDIKTHTIAHVLPNLPCPGCGSVYVLDNASNNKKVDDYLKTATADGVHDWLNENDPNPARFQTWWENESKKCSTAAQEKKAMFRYIRDNVDELTDLALFLRTVDVGLRYLPAYYPECNPIELIWAFIKREYKATDVNKPWRERLDEAHAKITEKQIEMAIDRSIRYSLDRLQELRRDGLVHNEDTLDPHVVYDEDDDHDSEDEWLNNE